MQFTVITWYMQLDPIILWSQCAWLISTFSERQYSSAYDEKFFVQVIYWSLPPSTHELVKHYQGYV